MINSRNIFDLHPRVQMMATKFMGACLQAGIEVIIISTERDVEFQNTIYAIGRTVKGANPTAKKPMGAIVTNAQGGQSFHNYQAAFDFMVLIGGKPQWNDIRLFTKAGEIGESVGLEWAGRWKSFKEYGHLQFTGGLTLKDFKEGKTL